MKSVLKYLILKRVATWLISTIVIFAIVYLLFGQNGLDKFASFMSNFTKGASVKVGDYVKDNGIPSVTDNGGLGTIVNGINKQISSGTSNVGSNNTNNDFEINNILDTISKFVK